MSLRRPFSPLLLIIFYLLRYYPVIPSPALCRCSAQPALAIQCCPPQPCPSYLNYVAERSARCLDMKCGDCDSFSGYMCSALPCPTLPYTAMYCPTLLSTPVLSCPALPCHTLTCPALPCPSLPRLHSTCSAVPAARGEGSYALP